MRRRCAHATGFTFFEILIVMTIIGILTGAVVLRSIGADHERNVETEAERLAALIELARGEALSRNESWGLFVAPERYGFKVYDERDGAWRVPSKHTFRTRNAPPDVAFSLQTEGDSQLDALTGMPEPESGAPDAEEDRDRDADLPQVLILASGEQTPFLISVGGDRSPSWSVASDGISRTRASSATRSEDRT